MPAERIRKCIENTRARARAREKKRPENSADVTCHQHVYANELSGFMLTAQLQNAPCSVCDPAQHIPHRCRRRGFFVCLCMCSPSLDGRFLYLFIGTRWPPPPSVRHRRPNDPGSRLFAFASLSPGRFTRKVMDIIGQIVVWRTERQQSQRQKHAQIACDRSGWPTRRDATRPTRPTRPNRAIRRRRPVTRKIMCFAI